MGKTFKRNRTRRKRLYGGKDRKRQIKNRFTKRVKRTNCRKFKKDKSSKKIYGGSHATRSTAKRKWDDVTEAPESHKSKKQRTIEQDIASNAFEIIRTQLTSNSTDEDINETRNLLIRRNMWKVWKAYYKRMKNDYPRAPIPDFIKKLMGNA